MITIIIMMVIFKCYFSREHIVLSIKNGVNIELGKSNRFKALCMIIIMAIFKCYFSGEHIALSLRKNNKGVNIEFGKTNN